MQFSMREPDGTGLAGSAKKFGFTKLVRRSYFLSQKYLNETPILSLMGTFGQLELVESIIMYNAYQAAINLGAEITLGFEGRSLLLDYLGR